MVIECHRFCRCKRSMPKSPQLHPSNPTPFPPSPSHLSLGTGMQQSQRHPRGHHVQRRPPRRLRRLLLGRSAAGAAQRAQQQREQHGVAAAHVENELREVEWQVKFLETLDDWWLIHYDCCDWLWFTADSLLIDLSKKMNGCWKMSGDILPFCCWYFEGVQESCGDCWGDTVIPMLGGEDRLTWKCGFAIVIPQTLSPHPSPPSNMWWSSLSYFAITHKTTCGYGSENGYGIFPRWSDVWNEWVT